MYVNLYTSMRGRGIDAKMLSACIKISRRRVRQKLRGYSDFTIEEAFLIRYRFFPDLALNYLFHKQETEKRLFMRPMPQRQMRPDIEKR